MFAVQAEAALALPPPSIRLDGPLPPRAAPVATSKAPGASVVTLCGLAVVLVVQPVGGQAMLYAGRAMESKLAELGLAHIEPPAHELADFYDPISDSCTRIRREHFRPR